MPNAEDIQEQKSSMLIEQSPDSQMLDKQDVDAGFDQADKSKEE